MSYSFKYKSVKRPGIEGYILTPVIPVSLSFESNQPIPVTLLLDSGADFSAMPRNLAEALGASDIDRRKKEKIKGLGGFLDVVYLVFDASIWLGHDRVQMKIPFAVPVDPANEFTPLIGRVPFFDRFEINFKQSVQKVSLKKEERRRV